MLLEVNGGTWEAGSVCGFRSPIPRFNISFVRQCLPSLARAWPQERERGDLLKAARFPSPNPASVAQRLQ